MAKAQVCVVCQTEKEVEYSLRLTKDEKGRWVSNPVCADCRRMLIRDARSAGRFIPFFGFEASEKEATKRNDQLAINRPFLEKFGRKFEKKDKQKSAKVLPIERKAG